VKRQPHSLVRRGLPVRIARTAAGSSSDSVVLHLAASRRNPPHLEPDRGTRLRQRNSLSAAMRPTPAHLLLILDDQFEFLR